jgi:hypothetical protein
LPAEDVIGLGKRLQMWQEPAMEVEVEVVEDESE